MSCNTSKMHFTLAVATITLTALAVSSFRSSAAVSQTLSPSIAPTSTLATPAGLRTNNFARAHPTTGLPFHSTDVQPTVSTSTMPVASGTTNTVAAGLWFTGLGCIAAGMVVLILGIVRNMQMPVTATERSTLLVDLNDISEVAMASSSGEKAKPDDKTINKMRSFAEQYLKRSDTYLCVDKSVAAVVLTGLAAHKEELGAPLCPCRNYEDKQAEADQGYWNCPCVPMRERKECHCMLFLTKDNDFVGTERTISMEEIKEYTEGMGM